MLSSVLGTEMAGRLPEVLGETGHETRVLLEGPGRIVAHTEINDHPLTQRCHDGRLS